MAFGWYYYGKTRFRIIGVSMRYSNLHGVPSVRFSDQFEFK